MPTINVNGAAARLLATGALAKAGLCLHYCWLAISQGKVHYITGGADTAYNTWLAVPAEHRHSSRIVPKDFPAFLGKKFFSSAGDVIISNGDGTFVATDWPKSKQVGVCTLEQREKQTGRKFVGWASSMGGHQLESTTTAGTGTLITEQIGSDMRVILHTTHDAKGNVTGTLHYLVDGITLRPLTTQAEVDTEIATWGPAVPVHDSRINVFVETVKDNLAAIHAPASTTVNVAGPTAAQIAAEVIKRMPTKLTGTLS